MNETKTLIFDLASMGNEKYPEGSIITFQDKKAEISLNFNPDNKKLTIKALVRNGKRAVEYCDLYLTIQEVVERLQLKPIEKESFSRKPRKQG